MQSLLRHRRGRLAGIAGLLATLAVAANVFAPGAADASPRLCRQLEAELAGLDRGGPASNPRYDRAIEAQQANIQKMRRQMNRAGCSGGFAFFSRNSGGGACSDMRTTLDRMQSNLASLERKRGQGGERRNVRRERARLLASIDANGCRDIARRNDNGDVAAAREGRGNIFEHLFGGGVSRRPIIEELDQGEEVRAIIRPGEFGGLSGSYRTLCVRTCDGYYWPISYASSGHELARDEKNCQTMCPGTEVKLFSHRVPEQESEQMVGLDGTAYVDLPTAFKYRDASFRRPEQCGCNPAKNFSIIAGGVPPVEAEQSPSFVPAARPDPAADPETLANRAGGLAADDVAKILGVRPPASGLAMRDRKVRVVGPEYLPDPEAALDLRAPARTEIR